MGFAPDRARKTSSSTRRPTRFALALGLLVLGFPPLPASGQESAPPSPAVANLDAVDHVLTTTRSVRRRLDLSRPVEPQVIEEAIEIALQAPTGSNLQNWRFMVVTDPAKKKAVADLYRQSFERYAGPRPSDTSSTPGGRIATLGLAPVRPHARGAGSADRHVLKAGRPTPVRPPKPGCTAQSCPRPGP